MLVAGASSVLLVSGVDARADRTSAACADAAEVAVLPSPLAPWTGAPLRVIVAAEKPLHGALSLVGPDGSVAAASRERHDGPPYFWFAEVARPAAGTWHAVLALDQASAGCGKVTRDIDVSAGQPARPQATAGSVWPLRQAWNRATENLYSAWIEKLFDAPLDQEPSWPALDKVLGDRSRNMLFDYLGLHEDQLGLVMRPDCADMPYFLRAYFAFKLGLPFGYSRCTSGGSGKPPRCTAWFNIRTPEAAHAAPPTQEASLGAPVAPRPVGLAATFGRYLKTVGDGVQSGAGRTLGEDNNTDFYPVALSQETLRPGAIYADPYGHVLVLVRRVAQSDGRAGVLFAADAEPDGTVTRKRFWRGNFLFAHEPGLGGPGFKRFRPIMREKNGTLRRLTNREIANDRDYGDFSLDQAKLPVEAFYDRMDEVMSPEPLDPARAMKEAITALAEQVRTRVTAVELGRKYQNGHGEVSMPSGPAIFSTTGAWEDFSTPARDFRLLIAIDVVRGFPDRVARQPERYAMPAGQSVAAVKGELEGVLASELAAQKFTYTRSDGSPWTLTLEDVIGRTPQFEMAYNPNDCVELRWGAALGSDEAATCRRHAPQAQRAKMRSYYKWFRERHWPARV